MAFINCTLILQIINFFIAFFIIKYFFFKPVLAEIHAEDTLQESLMSTVQAHRALVAQKEQALHAHWQSARHYFEQHAPSDRPPVFFSTRPAIIKPEFSEDQINDMAQKTTAELLKKVDHAR